METFFLNQTRVNYAVVSSAVADFKIDKYTFEVGGKNKSQEQIKNTPNAFIVKDNIEYGFKNVVPLWAFDLNYWKMPEPSAKIRLIRVISVLLTVW